MNSHFEEAQLRGLFCIPTVDFDCVLDSTVLTTLGGKRNKRFIMANVTVMKGTLSEHFNLLRYDFEETLQFSTEVPLFRHLSKYSLTRIGYCFTPLP